MLDVRKLVSLTPPPGLADWASERCPGLDRDALLIETVWAEDWSLACVLDEWARGRKVRAIRATCSACTESNLLWRARDGYGNYGFVQDWDADGPGTICVDGDETTCPTCGARVVVKTKSKLRGKGYFVAAEQTVMSAAVVGEEHLLALTCWVIERRIYANARRELAVIPAEAYVFSARDCAQLMGWRNAYSGTAGHFIQYERAWRQPKDWRDRWGEERDIFGLTPELVEASCLPHCKLDVYMADRGPGGARYPVAYLRLYQEHPTVEHILIHGLPRLLDDLLAEEAGAPSWPDKNRKGLVGMQELHWEECRPAQLLGLNKEELRLAQRQDWGVYFWRLFTLAKEAGEVLTEQDMVNAFSLGDDHVLRLIGRGPVGRSLRYLLRQAELAGVEPEGEDPDPHGVVDVQILLDYWTMCAELGRDLDDPAVRFPKDLIEAHDRAVELVQRKEDAQLHTLFRIRRKLLRRWSFAADGLLIRPVSSQRELIAEGDALHHCVKSYANKHASGRSAIFLIRRTCSPWTPFFTLELDEASLDVLQNRGRCNCRRTPEVETFEAKWLAWLRVGAPRDREGRPMPPRAQRIGGAA